VWASSDVLLAQLNAEPQTTLRRLGDGYYEQRLVTEQIMAGTGQRYVGDYRDSEAQYLALLNAGAEFAQAHSLTLGVALTEAQMRLLTTDMVWLVAQNVTLQPEPQRAERQHGGNEQRASWRRPDDQGHWQRTGQGNLTAIGANLSAGHNATLEATTDIDLRAAQNSATQSNTNRSSSTSVGIGFGAMGGEHPIASGETVPRRRREVRDRLWRRSRAWPFVGSCLTRRTEEQGLK
jgi:large exoprotein involved in heme utilization and adhesion